MLNSCIHIKQNARKVCQGSNQFGRCIVAGFGNTSAMTDLKMKGTQKQSRATEGIQMLHSCQLYCALLWLSITLVHKCLCLDAGLENRCYHTVTVCLSTVITAKIKRQLVQCISSFYL